MLILYSYEDLIKNGIPNSKNQTISWVCGNCGREHLNEQCRNLYRRQHLCGCQQLNQQIENIKNRLDKINYEFLDKDENAYTIGSSGIKINSLQPIKVKCLKCGKISYEYLHNLENKHKKCNCDTTKPFTRDLTIIEFQDKWPEYNQENWELLSSLYKGRNYKYLIKCKNCGKEDERWGLTLIDKNIKCKYCCQASYGELKIETILQKLNIEFLREVRIIIDGNNRFFDFYLPKYDTYIEFNGEQHYRPVDYFGGEERYKNQLIRDQQKIDWCKNNHHHLIIIRYDDTDEEIKDKLTFIK